METSDPLLTQLQDWYAAQCDGDWEHGFGVQISTLDNPGWSISINLEGTELEEVPFCEVRHNYDHETDWFICQRVDNTFNANGGPQHLETMLSIFLQWAKNNTPA